MTRLDKDVIKSRSRNQWPSILASLGVPADYLKRKHGPCPVCGGKDRFRFDDKDGQGTFYCSHCGAGDGFTLLMKFHGWTFADALKAVSELLGGNHTSEQRNVISRVTGTLQNQPDREAYSAIVKLWNSGQEIIATDPTGRYLRDTRGILLDSFPAALRFQPHELKYPALLAAFTNPGNKLVQVQRIELTSDGHKAPVNTPKKFQRKWIEGAMTGGAVKLYAPTDILAIGEGIETCLSFYAREKIPVWAATSAVLMQQVVIPSSVSTVIILADNDETGINAANQLAAKLSKEGRKGEIRIPQGEPGTDFADLYAHGGIER